MDDDVRAAIDASSLCALDDARLGELLVGAVRRSVPAGTVLRGEGDRGAHLELVVGGFVRIFVGAPDGRTLTIRYVRPGNLMGAVSLFRPEYRIPGSLQALVDADLLVLRTDVAAALCARDAAVAGAFLDELSARIVDFVAELPRGAFASVRQRAAHHLLEVASQEQHDARLVAPVSQQQLAEAVGSVREVVVRVLRELRADGLIRTGARRIEIMDPERLWLESVADGRGWNPGS